MESRMGYDEIICIKIIFTRLHLHFKKFLLENMYFFHKIYIIWLGNKIKLFKYINGILKILVTCFTKVVFICTFSDGVGVKWVMLNVKFKGYNGTNSQKLYLKRLL